MLHLFRVFSVRAYIHPIAWWVVLASSISVPCVAESIPGIGSFSEASKIAGGFEFTEGPAFDGERYLYFTDIPTDRIYRLDLTAKALSAPEVFVEGAGTCNGLMFDGEGHLIACRMEGEIISIDTATKQITTLVGQYSGNRFNACNDLVIDKTGGIYFTDPRFRAPQPWPQSKEAIYYRSASGETKRLADDFLAPNGIILSPDEKKLYVIPSMVSDMYVYDVASPGELKNRKVFCRLSQVPGKTDGGGDGLTVDTNGNLYITSATGLQVFDSAGKQLGTIALPEQPANVTFGGADNSTLYVTARKGLYAITSSARGHRFSGKVK
jgi:gluconolactonase